MRKKTLNVHISEEEHAHLRLVASERGVSMTNVIRSMIRRDIRRRAERNRELMAVKSMLHSGERPA